MRVELRTETRIDLVNGSEFYDTISPGLGERFLDCLREDLALLNSTAGIHELYRGFHRGEKIPICNWLLQMWWMWSLYSTAALTPSQQMKGLDEPCDAPEDGSRVFSSACKSFARPR